MGLRLVPHEKVTRLQLGELPLRYYTDVAVHVTLDLVLNHAVRLGQLANDGEDLAAVGELTPFGTKRDPRNLCAGTSATSPRPALLPVPRGFPAPPGLSGWALRELNPASISRLMGLATAAINTVELSWGLRLWAAET